MPLLAGIMAAVLLVPVIFISVLAAVLGDNNSGAPCLPTAPGHTATADIPPTYLALYVQAGARYGIPWNVLAAIGKAESDHGRGPGSGIKSGTNQAGAAGPMQFIPGTWKAFGVDGNGDGVKNVYDPADAIPSAAAYLKHNGAPTYMRKAIFAYNHANWYVDKVLDIATRYGQGADPSGCMPVPLGTGQGAVAVKAALRWIGTPYSWGGGGLHGPTYGIGRGAHTIGFDCSGLTRYAWYQAGVSLPRVAADQWRTFPHVPRGQEQPGDLVFFRTASGTTTNPGHVGLVTGGGRMIEAPYTGARVRISTIGQRNDLIGYARPGAR